MLRTPNLVIEDEEIFAAHVGGKLSVELKAPLDTQRALSIAYTPGVAQVSRAIAADHTLAARYTWANRLVAVVSDGRGQAPEVRFPEAHRNDARTKIDNAISRATNAGGELLEKVEFFCKELGSTSCPY